MPEIGDFEATFGSGPFAPAPGALGGPIYEGGFEGVDPLSTDPLFNGQMGLDELNRRRAESTGSTPDDGNTSGQVVPDNIWTNLSAEVGSTVSDIFEVVAALQAAAGLGIDGVTAQPSPIDYANEVYGGIFLENDVQIGGGFLGGGTTTNIGSASMVLAGGGRLAGGAAARGVLVSGAVAWASVRGAVRTLSATAGASRVGQIYSRLPGPVRTALKFGVGVLTFDVVSNMLGGSDDDDTMAIATIAAMMEDGIADGSILFRGGTDRNGNEVVPVYLTIGPLDSNNAKGWIHSRYYSAKSVRVARARTATKWFRGGGGRRQSRRK